jgi:MFS family permease
MTSTPVSAPAARRRPALLDQPRSVWAVAFAAVVAFMGIGLVDPILPTLAHDLDASPSQVSLLFTSYFAMTGLSMLITGWVASRIGPRRTLLIGLAGVIVFSALAGASGSVGEIAGFRLGWGLGNALFIATALSVIVGSASGGLGGAIMLYEAALGLGIASGPLLGGLLGGVSWRGPFFGTATLMAVGFLLIAVLLGRTPAPARRVSLGAPLKALAHPGLRSLAAVAVLYNFGFFTVLAYTPFPMGLGAHALGLVFFGWGLLLALTSVFGAQRLERRFGLVAVLTGALLAVAALMALSGGLVGSTAALAALVIVSGGLFGIVNTVLTEAVMAAAVVERPVASAAYSFVRFTGGAIAPFLAGKLGEHVSAGAPLFAGAGMVALSAGALMLSRRHLRAGPDEVESPPAEEPHGVVLVALGDPKVVARATEIAIRRQAPVLVAHVRETRPVGPDAVDLEDRGRARTDLDAAVQRLRAAGVCADGELLHVTGRHEDAADALLRLADRVDPLAIVVGRPSHAHPGEPSMTATLADRAPYDLLVVAS